MDRQTDAIPERALLYCFRKKERTEDHRASQLDQIHVKARHDNDNDMALASHHT